jgi:hypothetical protein
VSDDLHLAALRVPFVVTGLRSDELAVLAALWRPLLVTGSTDPDPLVVAVHDGPDGRAARIQDRSWSVDPRSGVTAAVSQAVNITAAAHTPLVAVHAAVLSRGDRTVVMPGPSGAGKSTATTVLLRAGWRYVSDEAFALDADGTVVAYPRPIALSRWTLQQLGLATTDAGTDERYLTAAELGAEVELAPHRPTTLVLLSPGTGDETAVEQPHRMDALEALTQRAFTRHTSPAATLRQLASVVRGSTVVRVRGSGPLERAASVRRLLDSGGG